jgi:hypothetical protein
LKLLGRFLETVACIFDAAKTEYGCRLDGGRSVREGFPVVGLGGSLLTGYTTRDFRQEVPCDRFDLFYCPFSSPP